MGAPDRVAQIAADIVEHFARRREAMADGKGKLGQCLGNQRLVSLIIIGNRPRYAEHLMTRGRDTEIYHERFTELVVRRWEFARHLDVLHGVPKQEWLSLVPR